MKINTIDLLRFGWEKTKNNYEKVICVILVFIFLGIANNFIQHFGQSNYSNNNLSFLFLSLFVQLGLMIIGVIIGVNFIKEGLLIVRGGEANLRRLLNYPDVFWKYIFGVILSTITIIAGLILFIVPGVVLAIRLFFMKAVLVDTKLGPIDSIAKSLEMTKGHTKDIFLFLISIAVFNLVGLMCLVIGLLITLPVTFFAVLSLYSNFLEQAKNSKTK